MQKNSDTPQNFSMEQAMRIASSPAGQQLLALLQREGGAEFQQAMSKAAAGDYAQARETLASLLSSPEAKALLKQLGR